ncbi:MAG: TrbC/VirB2 family protein [Acidobacteria bacterium]|nr:TrbC/VirB2 family protein [Acidobacteriota bacterium]
MTDLPDARGACPQGGDEAMRWYQKAGLSFVFGTGVLLCLRGFFLQCVPVSGMITLMVGTAALFASAPWLSGCLRRRAFRGMIRMRRRAGRAADEVSAALTSDPVLLRRWGTLLVVLFLFAMSVDVLAATNPWETAVMALCTAFSTTIGRGLALVAVIIAGLMFAFGEGGSKSAIAGLIFGAGMVLSAPAFLMWVGLAGATGC